MKKQTSEKIDMVYLWCDGNEKAFRERKNTFLKKENQNSNEEANGDKRFFDNEELRYSLRSLEQNAPWINHVFIVTDRQTPKWLNLNYKKVSIVDHSDILPTHIIPCFNSNVIEYFLAFIPNLSEKFLYGNDDTFFGTYLTPDFFFNYEKPIVRLKKLKYKEYNKYNSILLNNQKNYEWYANVANSLNILNQFYNKNLYYEPIHNIDSYTKSSFLSTFNRFKPELMKCFNNRFRTNNDIARILFNLDAVYSGNADLAIFNKPRTLRRMFHWLKKVNYDFYVATDSNQNHLKDILKYQPKLFCLNSGTNCSIEAKSLVKQFMEKLFPIPSKFEI